MSMPLPTQSGNHTLGELEIVPSGILLEALRDRAHTTNVVRVIDDAFEEAQDHDPSRTEPDKEDEYISGWVEGYFDHAPAAIALAPSIDDDLTGFDEIINKTVGEPPADGAGPRELGRYMGSWTVYDDAVCFPEKLEARLVAAAACVREYQDLEAKRAKVHAGIDRDSAIVAIHLWAGTDDQDEQANHLLHYHERLARIPAGPERAQAEVFAQAIVARRLRDRAEAKKLLRAFEPPDHPPPDLPPLATLAELRRRPQLLEPPEAVVPRLAWRARVVLLCGPDKSGKSTLLAHAAAALSRRTPFLGEATSGCKVVWCGLEEALGETTQRFLALGANAQNVRVVSQSLPDIDAKIRSSLREEPADLVVIDSLMEWARVTSEAVPADGDNAGWAAIIRPLARLAHSFNVALVVLHHVRRSDGQYRGASEIAAAVDAILELSTSAAGGGTVRKISGRGRGGLNLEPFSVALRDGCYGLHDPFGGTDLPLEVRVPAYIAQNPGTSKRGLRKAIGGNAGKVDAALQKLVEDGIVVHRGKKNGYHISDGTAPGDFLSSAESESGDIEEDEDEEAA